MEGALELEDPKWSSLRGACHTLRLQRMAHKRMWHEGMGPLEQSQPVRTMLFLPRAVLNLYRTQMT